MTNTDPPRRGRPRRPGGPTPTRTVRIGPIWDAAHDVAKTRGQTMAEIIEAALRRYIARHARASGDKTTEAGR